MQSFLTTEELLGLLNKDNNSINQNQIRQNSTQEVKGQSKKKIFKIIYFFFLAIAIIHIIFVSVPVFFKSNAVNIVGRQFVIAVPNDQELDNELSTTVVSIKSFKSSDININDQVVIYGKFGTNVFWIEDVVEVDQTNNIIRTTFDQILINDYEFDDIGGVVIAQSNLLGTMLFVSTQTRGYLILVIAYTVIFGSIYFFYFRKEKEPITTIEN